MTEEQKQTQASGPNGQQPTPETAETTEPTTAPEQSIEGEIVEEAVEEEGAAATADMEVQQRLAQAEDQANAYKDQWLRTTADFKNYKRRTELERTELIRSASSGLIAKLLPIIDDIERAMENVPDEVTQTSWWAGMQMIEQKLRTVLESEGVTPINALGQEFDPNFHDAVMYEEAENQENKVVAELQKGYMQHDRVLRPTMVKVGKG